MLITQQWNNDGTDERQVVELVSGNRDWIAAKPDQFQEGRHLLDGQESARPEAFNLPALAESWRVEYQTTKSKTFGARTDRHGRVLVHGAVRDEERCKAALRRWLARMLKTFRFVKMQNVPEKIFCGSAVLIIWT